MHVHLVCIFQLNNILAKLIDLLRNDCYYTHLYLGSAREEGAIAEPIGYASLF
jgi:hypothetical protein